MKEFQERKIIKKIVYSKFVAVILAVLLLLLIRENVELFQKKIEIDKSKEKTLKEKMLLETSLEKASEKRKYIDTERGKEEYVRTTYPVAKYDEGVIVVYQSSSSPVSSVKKEEYSFLDRIKQMFF